MVYFSEFSDTCSMPAVGETESSQPESREGALVLPHICWLRAAGSGVKGPATFSSSGCEQRGLPQPGSSPGKRENTAGRAWRPSEETWENLGGALRLSTTGHAQAGRIPEQTVTRGPKNMWGAHLWVRWGAPWSVHSTPEPRLRLNCDLCPPSGWTKTDEMPTKGFQFLWWNSLKAPLAFNAIISGSNVPPETPAIS